MNGVCALVYQAIPCLEVLILLAPLKSRKLFSEVLLVGYTAVSNRDFGIRNEHSKSSINLFLLAKFGSFFVPFT